MAETAFNKVSAFGLGKLGAVIAGCYATRGFVVTGVDVNPDSVDKCRSGIPPVQEPGIERLYESAKSSLTATTDGLAAVLDSDVTLITVPTPSDPDGAYSLRFTLEACRVIAQALSKKKTYHLVVLKSTVLPGSCQRHIIPALEAGSGKRCGSDFGFCYNPEFIALGSVIYNIFNPDLTLIGESDPAAGDHLVAIYKKLLVDFTPAIARMTTVNAELAKLAVNTYVTMKISFANSIAALCEKLPGGDAAAVTTALGRDTRIGPKYLKGGLGYGGPCFPRDNAAMLCLARELGLSFPLAEATDRVNDAVPGRIVDLVISKVSEVDTRGPIGILGLSYKPDTPVIDESQAIIIASELVRRGFDVCAYDPMAMEAARKVLASSVQYARSGQECVDAASIVVIATAWNEFKALDYRSNNDANGRIVIDCWGLLNQILPDSVKLVRLGTAHTIETRII